MPRRFAPRNDRSGRHSKHNAVRHALTIPDAAFVNRSAALAIPSVAFVIAMKGVFRRRFTLTLRALMDADKNIGYCFVTINLVSTNKGFSEKGGAPCRKNF